MVRSAFDIRWESDTANLCKRLWTTSYHLIVISIVIFTTHTIVSKRTNTSNDSGLMGYRGPTADVVEQQTQADQQGIIASFVPQIIQNIACNRQMRNGLAAP